MTDELWSCDSTVARVDYDLCLCYLDRIAPLTTYIMVCEWMELGYSILTSPLGLLTVLMILTIFYVPSV